VKTAARKPEIPVSPDLLRLVEGIALTLAQEDHARETQGKGLGGDRERREDAEAADA
jgi:hypothetical protein